MTLVILHYRYGGYWLEAAPEEVREPLPKTALGNFSVPDGFWRRYQRHELETAFFQDELRKLWERIAG